MLFLLILAIKVEMQDLHTRFIRFILCTSNLLDIKVNGLRPICFIMMQLATVNISLTTPMITAAIFLFTLAPAS